MAVAITVKEITLGELNHLKSVLEHCEDEFRALEEDGEYSDTDGTFDLLKEALSIINPLLEKKDNVE